MILSVNTLIQLDDNPSSIERVIWIDEKYQHCFLINVFDNALPTERDIKELEDRIEVGMTVFVYQDPWALLSTDQDISEKAKVVQKKAWEVLSKVLEIDFSELLNKSSRNKIINQVAMETGVHSKTILKYLKRYWKRGMNRDALLPDFNKKGGFGKEKVSGDKKRGRPRKVQQIVGEGVNITEDIKAVFRLAVNKYYETKRNVSVRFTYEQMVKEFFKRELEEAPGKIPSYNQFLYWIRKEQNLSKEIIRRSGKRTFDLSYRPVLGSATNEVRSPGEKIEIDATVADVYLCSEFNKSWIIGRPILYLCKCSFSQMIMGIHIGLEGPNFEQARLALMNMVENKVQFCKRYDIEISENEWPTAHLPNSIVADRAELLSNASNVLTDKLNIRLENTGAWRGDLKSLIERQFGLLTNEVVKPFLPGAVDKDFGKRGTKDHRLSGKLTMKDFMQILIKYVLYYNNHHILENFVRDEEMINSEVEVIPIKLWDWGLKNRAGRLRTISKELMMLHTLPTAIATVTEQGIKFQNILYGSNVALKEQWFVKARFKKSWKVEITYDPRDLSNIYLRGVHKDAFERCYLLEHQSRYKNKNLNEVLYLQEHEKIIKNSQKHFKLKAKVELMEDVEKIVRNAENKAKLEGVTESNNKRIKDIKNHRKFEQERIKQEHRNEVHRHSIKIDEINSNVSSIYEEVEGELSLLKQMQKKGLNKRER